MICVVSPTRLSFVPFTGQRGQALIIDICSMPERVRDLFNSIFEAVDVLNITEEIDHLAETYVPKVLSRQNTRTMPSMSPRAR